MSWHPYMELSGSRAQVLYRPADPGQPWIIHRGGKRWLVTAWHEEANTFVIDDAEEITS